MQILATGLDEEYKKPKGLADQVVRMLDEDGVIPSDRLRLLMLYLLYRDGLLPADTSKLPAHAQLPPQDGEVIRNMDLLGARTSRGLKDPRPVPPPLFPKKPPPTNVQDEYSLSRYETVLQNMLQQHVAGTLDSNIFPFTKPPLDMGDEPQQSAASLRTANKPTWARQRTQVSTENRQRIVVFMAGGATYSEARACYDVGRASAREIFLATTHMLTPALFIRQLGDLSADRRRLNIPAEMPKPQAPRHLFEPYPQPRPAGPPAGAAAPPTQAMSDMRLNGNGPGAPPPLPAPVSQPANSSAKLSKEPEKEKKKKGLLGFGKKS